MSEVINTSKVLQIKVNNENYIDKYLQLWKGYLDLTAGDIAVLKEFIIIFHNSEAQNEDLAFIETFSKDSRKAIADKLKISEYSFNNIFMRLKNKKRVIIHDKYGYKLNSKVLPVEEVTFKFKFDE